MALHHGADITGSSSAGHLVIELRLPVEEVQQHGTDGQNPCCAADKQNPIDLFPLQLGLREHLAQSQPNVSSQMRGRSRLLLQPGVRTLVHLHCRHMVSVASTGSTAAVSDSTQSSAKLMSEY